MAAMVRTTLPTISTTMGTAGPLSIITMMLRIKKIGRHTTSGCAAWAPPRPDATNRFGVTTGYSLGTIFAMENSEVYPNAPLALVVAEVRYPSVTDTPPGMRIQRQIRDVLGSDWLIHNGQEKTFQAGVNENGPHASLHSEAVHRITSRSRTKIITTRADRFSVEVTDYAGYASFRELVHNAASAVEQVLGPDGISRIGLRYIDEISVKQPKPHWNEWLARPLMPPTMQSSTAAINWTGTVQYAIDDDRIVILNYGTYQTPVVASGGPLKRPRVPEGPIFVLDFDSSWQPEEIPEFTASLITTTTDELRAPVRELFDSLLLPSVIDTFRQEPTR